MIIPYAVVRGRHLHGLSSLTWPSLTAILLNFTDRSQIGRDIRIKGSGESAFITNYLIPMAITVKQGGITEPETSVIYNNPNYRGNTSIARSIMSTAR
jgi:hypothetical protein